MFFLKSFTQSQTQHSLKKAADFITTVSFLIMSSNTRGDTVVRWTIGFGVIDTLAVVLRFLVRKKSGTRIAADDWMIVASLVPAYCMIASASLCELLSSGCSWSTRLTR